MQLNTLYISMMYGEKIHVTYLHYVDKVVRQPKEAESQHDRQDKFLTANSTTEPGLSNPPQDEDVADYYDGIWN